MQHNLSSGAVRHSADQILSAFYGNRRFIIVFITQQPLFTWYA